MLLHTIKVFKCVIEKHTFAVDFTDTPLKSTDFWDFEAILSTGGLVG